MKQKHTDPGVVQAFRYFAGVKLIIALFSLAAPLILVNLRFFRQQPNPFIPIAEALLLILFLSIPWLENKLGRFYLPIGIAIATIGPIVANILSFDTFGSEELVQVRALAGQWQVVFLLFVPVILVAWQYRFRIVLLYCVAIALLDFMIILPLPAIPTGRIWFELNPIIFRTLVYLLVGFIVNRLVRAQREQNNRLHEAFRQLSTYATTTEQLTLSRERNRLARELHDTLAHSLSAVAVQLEAVASLWDSDRPKAREMLDQSLLATRSGLAETRRAIQSLRAAPVEGMGLEMALPNLARTYAERYEMALLLKVPDQMNQWDPAVENAFYRIAEEALRNVAQHAGAKNLSVILQNGKDELNLSIRDDGRGFILDQQSSDEDRFGLRGMKERAEAIGAMFSIDSNPGSGTLVSVGYVRPAG